MKKYLWLILFLCGSMYAQTYLSPLRDAYKLKVSKGYDSTATTVVLSAGQGAYLPTSNFDLIWYNASAYFYPFDDVSNVEHFEWIHVGTRNGDTLQSVLRGQMRTTKSNHNQRGYTYKVIPVISENMWLKIDSSLSLGGSTFYFYGNDDPTPIEDSLRVTGGYGVILTLNGNHITVTIDTTALSNTHGHGGGRTMDSLNAASRTATQPWSFNSTATFANDIILSHISANTFLYSNSAGELTGIAIPAPATPILLGGGVSNVPTFYKLVGEGGAAVTMSNDSIYINAGAGGGDSVTAIQSPAGTITVTNPNGPTVSIDLATGGVSDSNKLANGVVTSLKVKDGSLNRIDMVIDFKAPYADSADHLKVPADSTELGTASVTSTKIKDGDVNTVDFAATAKPNYAGTADYSLSTATHYHPADQITSGTFGITRGGTGSTGFTAGTLIMGNGTSPLQIFTGGTAYYIPRWSGTAWVSSPLDSLSFLIRSISRDNLRYNIISTAQVEDHSLTRDDVATNFKSPDADSADYARNVSGALGGDNEGSSLPNPVVAPNKITSEKILDGTITASDLSITLQPAQNPAKVYYVSNSFTGNSSPYFSSMDSAWRYACDSATFIIYPGKHKVKKRLGWGNGQTAFRYVTIQGFGKSSIFYPDTTGADTTTMYWMWLFYSGDSIYLTLKDFAIDIRGDVYTGISPRCIDLNGVSHVRIDGLYLLNGNDVQDKGAIQTWDSHDITVNNCEMVGFDCPILLTSNNEGKNYIITNNRIFHGNSEGIILWSSTTGSPNDQYIYDHANEVAVIANNILYSRATTYIKVANNWIGNVTIMGNVMGRAYDSLTQYKSTWYCDGITIDSSSHINMIGNTYYGNNGGFFFLFRGDCRHITVANNMGFNLGYNYGAGFYQIRDATMTTVPHRDFIVTGNQFHGLRNAMVWSATRTFNTGDVVTLGSQSQFYICKKRSLNNAVTDADYWLTTVIGDWDYPMVKLDCSNLIFKDNIITGHHRDAVQLAYAGMENVDIVGNHITNCRGGIQIIPSSAVDTTGNYDLNNFNIKGNTIITNDSSGTYRPLYVSYIRKWSNSKITDNYIKQEYPISAAVIFYTRNAQNLLFADNTISSTYSGMAIREFYSVMKKRENVFTNSASTIGQMNWSVAAPTIPIGGWVSKGERFQVWQPAATDTTTEYICTTAGYTYRETYNAATAYLVGEHVYDADDSKVYECILNSTAHDPHLSATYFKLAGNVGTPLAVFKGWD